MLWWRGVMAGAGTLLLVGITGPAWATAGPTLPMLHPVSSAGASASVTTVRLTANRHSSKYDSVVKFTARVSARRGTPAGRVVFADASNGSYLAVESLRRGAATLSTAALAPGTRRVIAEYLGSKTFRAARSGLLKVTVRTAGTDAVAYQIDASHDGYQSRDRLSTRGLTRKWTRTLAGPGGDDAEAGDVSYPVIAGGRVFVTVENAQSYGSVLYALSARTGRTDWSVGLGGTYGFSALTYDGQRVFALNYDGVLTAFTASTGHEDWSGQLAPEDSFDAPPTAYDGMVYISGGGALYAVSEAAGTIMWGQSVNDGDKSSPAVDSSGVYVSYACQQDYRFLLTGKQAWHDQQGCYGGGGSTAVINGKSVYARGAYDAPVILAKSAGRHTGSFASDTAPAVDGGTVFTLQQGKAVAVAASGSPNRWTFGSGTLVTAPVVSNGVVFVGSSTGVVYGVSASTGRRVWSGAAGSAILGPDEQDADVLIGMAIGNGVLVVPAGHQVTAFG